jgi:hypothetical protein
MIRVVLSSAVLLIGMMSQNPFPSPNIPTAKSALKDSEYPVVVAGCLRGTRLKLDRTAANAAVDSLGASEFVMEGAKELLQQIRREHDGHQDEITGIAIVPAADTDEKDTATKPLGKKTRITVGTRSGGGAGAEGFRPVRLKVQSLRHIDDKCSLPS